MTSVMDGIGEKPVPDIVQYDDEYCERCGRLMRHRKTRLVGYDRKTGGEVYKSGEAYCPSWWCRFIKTQMSYPMD